MSDKLTPSVPKFRRLKALLGRILRSINGEHVAPDFPVGEKPSATAAAGRPPAAGSGSPAVAAELTVEEVRAILAEDPETRLLDVREEWEIAIAALAGAQRLTPELARELLSGADRERRYIFMCHKGGRSLAAARYFAEQGFTRAYSMRGGIEAWSQRVDSAIPRY